MKNYFKAEILKTKRTFLRKILFISPILTTAIAFFMMAPYFTIDAYNWWYVVMMPATFSIIPSLINRIENRKLKYRAIFSLNVDLKKLWISKVFVSIYFGAIATFLHMITVFAAGKFIPMELTGSYDLKTLALSSFLLLITNIWQFPLCAFLAKKFGFIASVLINTIFGITMGIIFSTKKFWLLCPYSYGARLMIRVLKVNPNGLPTEPSDPLINGTSLLIPSLISVAIFLILTFVTANYFKRQEVK